MRSSTINSKRISKRTTARSSDIRTESELAKNARPVVLLYSWLLFTMVIIAAFFGVRLPDSYMPMLLTLFTLVNGAYFGMRTYEKVTQMKNNGN